MLLIPLWDTPWLPIPWGINTRLSCPSVRIGRPTLHCSKWHPKLGWLKSTGDTTIFEPYWDTPWVSPNWISSGIPRFLTSAHGPNKWRIMKVILGKVLCHFSEVCFVKPDQVPLLGVGLSGSWQNAWHGAGAWDVLYRGPSTHFHRRDDRESATAHLRAGVEQSQTWVPQMASDGWITLQCLAERCFRKKRSHFWMSVGKKGTWMQHFQVLQLDVIGDNDYAQCAGVPLQSLQPRKKKCCYPAKISRQHFWMQMLCQTTILSSLISGCPLIAYLHRVRCPGDSLSGGRLQDPWRFLQERPAMAWPAFVV